MTAENIIWGTIVVLGTAWVVAGVWKLLHEYQDHVLGAVGVVWFALAGFVILALVALALYGLTLLPPIIAIALIAIWAVNAINRGRQRK
jgi:hypothetical protein